VEHLLDGDSSATAYRILEKDMIRRGGLPQQSSQSSAAGKTLGIHRNTLSENVAYEVGGTHTRPRRNSMARAGHTRKRMRRGAGYLR